MPKALGQLDKQRLITEDMVNYQIGLGKEQGLDYTPTQLAEYAGIKPINCIGKETIAFRQLKVFLAKNKNYTSPVTEGTANVS